MGFNTCSLASCPSSSTEDEAAPRHWRMFLTSCVTRKPAHFDIWRTCVTVELINLHTEFPMAKEKLSPLHRPKLEIADIFRAQGHAWRLANAGHVSLSQLKVMSAIEACRTEALGGHVAGCTKCGHHHIAYNSCKNRHCPKCQGPAARDWMEARAEDLLPVEYFHVVFTLPAEIAQIAYWNKKAVYGLLFKASAETVKTIAADPKRLGVNVGLTSVLHTWGSAMTHHPHIHMIVPGGGLSPDGNRWVACKPGFFLPVRVLSRLFRRLFLDGLMALHRAGDLAFFGDLEHLVQAGAFAAWLAPFRKSKWVVYSKPPFGGPEAVLAYLSRSRACLSQPLHPSSGDLKPSPRQRRRRHGGVPLEGLPRQGRRSSEGYGPGHVGVHPTFPDACPTRRVPSHPALRPTGQRRPQIKPRQMPCVALRPAPGTGECTGSGASGARGHPAHAA